MLESCCSYSLSSTDESMA